MTIYDILTKYRKNKHAFEKTSEYEYFMKNRDVLNKMPRFDFLFNRESNEFDIIRANILIQAYKNKTLIEQEVTSVINQMDLDNVRLHQIIKEKIVDLPYLNFQKNKIYVPLFNLPMNIVYTRYPEKLVVYPYNELQQEFQESVIDLFDTYGTNLYDSYFTRLIKIDTNGSEVAFFNYDTNAIYIVNSQGRLDNQIFLFDKYMKKTYDNHMLERLKPVVESYFKGNREDFIKALKDNDFISDKLVAMIKKLDYEN